MLAGKENVIYVHTDTKCFIINFLCSVSVEVQHATPKPMRKSKYQGSGDSSDKEVSSILPRKYILCNAEKYFNGCKREKRCKQIRVNKKIHKYAT